MAILLFQIVLFFIITYFGYLGRIQLTLAVICAVIFTISMVNTSGLFIIQFGTIVAAYLFSLNRTNLSESNASQEISYYRAPRKKNFVELILLILFYSAVLLAIIYGTYKFTPFLFSNFDFDSESFPLMIFGILWILLVYILILIFPVIIARLIMYKITDNLKDLISRFNN